VFDQRTGFVAVKSRHHDIHEYEIRLIVGDFRQCIETVDRREHLATFLGQQSFSSPTNGLAIVNYKNLEPA
jgi:hypothetical protein